jgi:hypothetical protein
VFIRAIRNIDPGDEINYDYGTDYFKAYLKPIGCKCDACEKKRKKKRAEARAERARLKAKAERKAQKDAEKQAAKRARDKKANAKSKAKAAGKSAELKPDRKRKLDSRSKAPNVRLKTGVGRTKRKVADGVRRNGGVSASAGRAKSAVAASAMPQAASMGTSAELAAATPETVFAVPNIVVPAANVEEAQQAST